MRLTIQKDSQAYAGRLADRLGERFGQDNIFMDVDTIAPGQDFIETIGKAVAACDVMIVVIGRPGQRQRTWLGLPPVSRTG